MDALVFLFTFGIVAACIACIRLILRMGRPEAPAESPRSLYVIPPRDADAVFAKLRAQLGALGPDAPRAEGRVADVPPPESRPKPKPKPRPDSGPGYLRRWTAARRLDARREQEIWQKNYDSMS